MNISHLFRDADLIIVEIDEVLFAVFGVVKDLRQRFVAVLVGVDIGVAAFVGVLLQQAAAVPDEVGAFRVGTCPGKFVLAFFGKASSERVVGVFPMMLLPLPFPSAVLSERMLWAGSKAKVSLRPVWLLRAS